MLKRRMPDVSASSISAVVLPTPEKTTLEARLQFTQQDSFEFAARDDIETGALLSNQAQNRKRGVSFDRIADSVRNRTERLIEGLQPRADGFCGVNVERGAETIGEMREIGVLATKRQPCRKG